VAAHPAEADVVLLVAPPVGDPILAAVRANALYGRFRSRALVYSEADAPAALYAGMYAGVPRRWLNSSWAVAGPYIQKLRDSTLINAGREIPVDLLYSFVGSSFTHPLRLELLKLRDDRCLLRDTSTSMRLSRSMDVIPSAERQALFRPYDEELARSAFVLCPPGRSPASIRFFETLRAGRVPVVFGDDWVLPEGPNWDDFIVRVPKDDVASVPERLRLIEAEATERGALAAAVWDAWYAPEVFFDCFVDNLVELQAARTDSWMARVWRSRLLFAPEYRQATLRRLANCLPYRDAKPSSKIGETRNSTYA
jgi:hypothetical protein